MTLLSREEIVESIYKSIKGKLDAARIMFSDTQQEIGYFYIDNLLPSDLAELCSEVFPNKNEMRCLKSLKEYKYVSAQMDTHNPLLEEILYAFQDEKIIRLICDICNIKHLQADESLYAGGLSLMAKDNFLSPHLDNSHDAERKRWRVLNLLYYVSPNWDKENGGHLELWPNGPKNDSIEIKSKFNRLVVMATHNKSWHSVNKVNVDRSRFCISNYYFSETSLNEDDSFHVTTYRGRQQEHLKSLVLNIDAKVRTLVRKIFKNKLPKNPHVYKKEK